MTGTNHFTATTLSSPLNNRDARGLDSMSPAPPNVYGVLLEVGIEDTNVSSPCQNSGSDQAGHSMSPLQVSLPLQTWVSWGWDRPRMQANNQSL